MGHYQNVVTCFKRVNWVKNWFIQFLYTITFKHLGIGIYLRLGVAIGARAGHALEHLNIERSICMVASATSIWLSECDKHLGHED